MKPSQVRPASFFHLDFHASHSSPLLAQKFAFDPTVLTMCPQPLCVSPAQCSWSTHSATTGMHEIVTTSKGRRHQSSHDMACRARVLGAGGVGTSRWYGLRHMLQRRQGQALGLAVTSLRADAGRAQRPGDTRMLAPASPVHACLLHKRRWMTMQH